MKINGKMLAYAIVAAVFAALMFFGTYSQGPEKSSDYNYLYSYTKAICSESNYCEDYEVSCSGGFLESISPTGMAVQMPQGWEDPRSREIVEKTC